MKRFFYFVVMMSCLICNNSFATNMEIEADNSLEWHREDKLYVAKGNVNAKQGDRTINSEILYAHYDDSNEKDIEIWKVEAKKNVLITQDDIKILGDDAVYDVNKQEFHIKGNNLNVLSKDYQIKANKKIEYFEKDNQVTANGNVIIYRAGSEMRCDRALATLYKTPEGKTEIKEIFAFDNLEIITEKDKITGDYGHYDFSKESAEVEGNVVIARENSVITGDKAIVNMKTGVAKMKSLDNSSRVKAIFVTKEEKQ